MADEVTVTPKFTTRDLINVGIFTAIYFVVLAVCGQLGALVPILQVLGPFYIPLICGIPFVLFLTRVKTFGMITIMGIVVGALILLTGQSWVVTVLAVILAPIADLVARAGHYTRWPNLVGAYVIFSEMLIGMVVPLFFQRTAFLERLSGRHDAAWVDSLRDMTPSWMFYVMIAMLAVGAVLGAYLGRAMFHKHFSKAGVH
jgi:energy-coupling factor transport system substrate-specific component